VYGSSVRIRSSYKFHIVQNHYGDLNNEFAVEARKSGQYVRVKDSSGKAWLLMDFSDGSIVEAETISSSTAKYDMDIVITPFMNKLRSNPKILDLLESDVSRITSLLVKQQSVINSLSSLSPSDPSEVPWYVL